MNHTQKHRDACDACHYRKIRCPFAGPGACSNCQNSGRVCVFSPRDEMGRPKKGNLKRPRENARKKSSVKDTTSKKQDTPDPSVQSTEDEILTDAFTGEESSMPIEALDRNFPEDWQEFLSFPANEEHFAYSPSALPPPSTIPNAQRPAVQLATPVPSEMSQTPSLVSSEQQHARMNLREFPGLSSTVPAPPPSPIHNNTVPMDVSHCSADTSLQTHQSLSTILYDLRLEYGKQWSSPEFETSRREAIFRSVSLLCDIVQEVLMDCEASAGTPADIDSETNITWMLSLTAVSMILNIYKSLCQMYSAGPEIIDIRRSIPNAQVTFTPLMSPPSKASASLDKVVQLTTMDFHLARLQRMFRVSSKSSNFQTALVDTDEAGGKIQELRSIVQRLVEKLKTL